MPRYTRYALLGVFVNQFGAFLQAFMILYLTYRGFAEWEASLALGGYAAGAIVGTMLGGWLTDRLGSRLTIVLAVGSAALLTLSVTMLPSLPAIVVAVFLAGAMTMVARPAITSLLLASVPPARQVMVQAMYRTALSTGAAAGPLVAAWLSTIEWNLVFYFDAAAATAYCLIALFLFPRDRGTRTDEAPAEEATRPGYLVLLRDFRYLGYLAVMFANGLVHIQIFAVLPEMLNDAGYPTVAYSSAITASAAFVICFELLITKVTQRWPLWIAVGTGWLLLVIGRGGYGLFELGGLAIVLAATLLAALGQVIGGPAAFAYPARVAPPGMTGRYLGSAFGMFQAGYTVGPILGIALWTQLGMSFWGVLTVFGVAVTGLLVWSMRPATPAEVSSSPQPQPQEADSTHD
ncbi:MAG TPA: MFS transporter [Natronosporangium sp.]